MKFVADHRQSPFFLFLPFTISHVAIQVPEDSLAEYRGRWDDPPYDGKKGYQPHPTPRAAYAAMVTRMDRTVGRIMDRVRELGLDDDTIVLFTSDNGPTHDGVGGSDSAFFDSTAGLHGLKGKVYEGGIRVPMIVRWPGKVAPHSTTDLIAYFPDLMPTLLDLVGAGEATPANLDGISFAATVLGHPETQKRHEFLYWEFASYGGQQAVRLGPWKGVRPALGKGQTEIELYNLDDDPNETRNVAQAEPAVVAQIAAILRREHTPSPLFPLPTIDPK